jgi:glyceraldehyde-3-phosphate dehydrogenase [NAD(P)+]
VFARISAADQQQAEAALDAAANTQTTLRETTIPERVAWLETIADPKWFDYREIEASVAR